MNESLRSRAGGEPEGPATGEVPGLAPQVLVVDDSALVRRTVHRLLSDAGYRVSTAASGEEAFDLCLHDPFDLVVSDVTMGALSGFQLCRLLRSDPATADTPVVLLTAAGDPRSRFWGRHAGADEYLSKEHMQARLVPAVERLLESGTRPASTDPQLPATAPSSADPMQRLAQVLDRHLFDAVVSSELRTLMAHIDDRRQFLHAAIQVIGEVAEYAYLIVRLEGPKGPTCAIHALGPWPDVPSTAALAGLGLLDQDMVSLDMLVTEGPALPDGHPVPSGEMLVFPIRVASERLGELAIFGGRKRVAATDRRTLELVAEELAVLVKSLFLMEQAQRLAQTDELTALANRRTAGERLDHEIARAERTGRPLSVLLCDVDHFKKVNDRYGHGIGDEILRRIAAAMQGAVREVDLVGRWGGEEFLIVLPEAAEAGARVVAERLRAVVAGLGAVPDGPERVTVSVGTATWVRGQRAETLVDRADEALYRAKERGRNRVEVAYVTPPAPARPGPGAPGASDS